MPAVVHHLTRQVGSLVLIEREDILIRSHFRVVGCVFGEGILGIAVALV